MSEQNGTPTANPPEAPITLNADEDITITLKGFTLGFLNRMIEEAPMPRAAYTQISADFAQAIRKAKAPK